MYYLLTKTMNGRDYFWGDNQNWTRDMAEVHDYVTVGDALADRDIIHDADPTVEVRAMAGEKPTV